jgi:hypothetical protein
MSEQKQVKKIPFYETAFKANSNRIIEAKNQGFNDLTIKGAFKKSGIDITVVQIRAVHELAQTNFVTKSADKKDFKAISDASQPGGCLDFSLDSSVSD